MDRLDEVSNKLDALQKDVSAIRVKQALADRAAPLADANAQRIAALETRVALQELLINGIAKDIHKLAESVEKIAHWKSYVFGLCIGGGAVASVVFEVVRAYL